MNSIKVTKIEVDAELGSDLRKCLIDCIELSMTEQVDIQLLYNNRTYKTDFNELIEIVEKTAN